MGSRDFKDNPLRGFVIPIGGAEEKLNDPVILSRFVELCDSDKARIAIIPTASQLEDTGPNYEKVFKDLGAGEAISLAINTREDAQEESFLETLESCNGIFITGGNQLRLSTILGGTPITQAIRRLNTAGVHLAGTSAGAAIIPEHMIAGGSKGALPTQQGVTFAPGLGLLNKVIIDQHFSQRNRLGRLLSAVSYNPFASGLGICEDTAAFIGPDNELEVIGNGSITVIDPSGLEHSSMAEAERGDSLTLLGIKMHILSEGASYNIETREAQPKLS